MTEKNDRFNLGFTIGIVFIVIFFLLIFGMSKVSSGQQKCEIGDRIQIVNTTIVGTVTNCYTSSFTRYYDVLVDCEDKTVSLTTIEVKEKDIIKLGKPVTPTTKESK